MELVGGIYSAIGYLWYRRYFTVRLTDLVYKSRQVTMDTKEARDIVFCILCRE